MPKPQFQITLDRVAEVAGTIAALANTRVLVGIPSDRAGTRDGPINNAALGYIHENGAPEVHIPARPHLVPGVRSVAQTSTIPRFRKAAEAAFEGRGAAATKQLEAAGQEAADGVRRYIDTRIPPPLAESTILGRLRRLKSYQRIKSAEKRAEKRQEYLDAPEGFTPLEDTGKLYRAYTYVLRKAK